MEPHRLLRSQSGQGIVEYLLVLVVTVGIILGAIMQFNSAFKSWAQAYFGDYLTCLFETGELPIIDGTPGDSGVCNSLFQPFSFTAGRTYVGANGSGGGSGSGHGASGGESGNNPGKSANAANARAARSAAGGKSGGGGGGGGGMYAGGSLAAGGRGQSSGFADGSGQPTPADTGHTNTSKYGSNFAFNKKSEQKKTLDNRFAFEKDDGQKKEKRNVASSGNHSSPPEDRAAGGLKSRDSNNKKIQNDQNDGPFALTIGNFFKWILIAAVIIALVLLIGGQMLQVSKSMD
jgi:hypothetical protein